MRGIGEAVVAEGDWDTGLAAAARSLWPHGTAARRTPPTGRPV